MREKIKRKLRSRQGATLLLALLLFLVCAAAGSVAITAGTASSGVVSERAKMDQRYFSVTSAAELLRKKLNGISVGYVSETGTVNISDPNVTDTLKELLKDQTLYLISAFDNPANADELKDNAMDWKENAYKVTASVSSGDGLEATVTISKVALGSVEFTIESAIRKKNANGQRTQEKEAEKFGLIMKYVANPVPTDNGFNVTWEAKDIRLAD